MSRNKNKPHLDFIHKYDETLNLIYRRWEEQIKRQANTKSKDLLINLLFNRKTVFIGITLVATYLTLVFLYGSWLITTLQKDRQADSTKDLVSSNNQALRTIAYKLDDLVDTDASLFCTRGQNVYKLHQEVVQSFPWPNEPKAFTVVPGPVTITKYTNPTQTPTAYLRLDPDSNLLFDYTDENEVGSRNNFNASEPNQELTNLSTRRYSDSIALADFHRASERYKAVSLYREFSECIKPDRNTKSIDSNNVWLESK